MIWRTLRRPSAAVWPWWVVLMWALVKAPDAIAYLRFGEKPGYTVTGMVTQTILLVGLVAWSLRSAILAFRRRKLVKLKEEVLRAVMKVKARHAYRRGIVSCIRVDAETIFHWVYILSYNKADLIKELGDAKERNVNLQLISLGGRFDVPRTTIVTVHAVREVGGHIALDLSRMFNRKSHGAWRTASVAELTVCLQVLTQASA